MGFPWYVGPTQKLVFRGPLKNRTDTTLDTWGLQNVGKVPQDRVLHPWRLTAKAPENDALENDVTPLLGIFSVRYWAVNLSGCTPLIPFANEIFINFRHFYSPLRLVLSRTVSFGDINEQRQQVWIQTPFNRGSVFPDLSCDQQQHQVWCHKFVVLEKNTGSNPLVVFPCQVNGATHLVFLEKNKRCWFYKVHQKNHERIWSSAAISFVGSG